MVCQKLESKSGWGRLCGIRDLKVPTTCLFNDGANWHLQMELKSSKSGIEKGSVTGFIAMTITNAG